MTVPTGDLGEALAKYRRWAATYDRTMDTPVWHRARARSIARLDLRSGDTVLDVACGTGPSFGLLEERVGEKGLIVGVDASPEMLSEAWSRTRRAGWQNIELIEAPVEEAKRRVTSTRRSSPLSTT